MSSQRAERHPPQSMMERPLREWHQALRSLWRTRSFTVTCVVVLGLGIGMATTMFAVFNAVLLRPLPVQAPGDVVLLRTLDPGGVDVGLRRDEIRELAAASRTLRGAAGVAHQGAFEMTLLYGERVLTLNGAWVTGNFFELLGIRPVLGRLFESADEVQTGAMSSPIVLSYDTWQRQFGGDSGVVGRHVTTPYSHEESTILGVAPPGLAYPPGTQFWSPVAYQSIDVIARLAPGVTPGAARDEFFAIMQRLDSVRVVQRAQGAHIVRADVRGFASAVLGSVRPPLLVLAAAVGLLLLIACVNVGNLVLLRATSREAEFAVRRSLGAGAADIVRPLVWESVAIALAGGALGLACAEVLLGLLSRMAPATLPRLDVVRLAAAPLGLAVMVTLVALVLAGVIPAMVAARGGLATPLRMDARSGRATTARRRLRQGLVASQVALALIMTSAAALLVRSMDHLLRVPLGFRADHLSIITMAKPVKPDSSMEQLGALYDRVAPALRALPGVVSISPVATGPFYGPQVFVGRWAAAGQTDAESNANPLVPFEVGGRDYFRTFDIPLLRGRGFLETDVAGAARVVVVSEALAKRFWPGENPVGKQVRLVGDDSKDPWVTVVGEAGDIRYRDLRQSTPTIFVPWRQLFFQGIVAVRTTDALAVELPAFRRIVREADPEAVIARSVSMDELLSGQRTMARLSTLLLAGFGIAALLLAAIGVYGVMATAVRERTREFGIRAALGASPTQLRSVVLRQAGGIAIAGGAVGVIGALAMSRYLRALLYEVSPDDPVAMLGAFGVLLTVALVAAYVPAWRATRVDPAGVLRAE